MSWTSKIRLAGKITVTYNVYSYSTTQHEKKRTSSFSESDGKPVGTEFVRLFNTNDI